MTEIAILGYGTVGSGVAEVIGTNAELIAARGCALHVKYILDLRDFPGDPYGERVVHDFTCILDDPEIKVICETMGGVGAAYQFSKQALEKGISVCTSNKELVELHGAELSRIAKENHCSYLFEASVGGGIPLIRTICQGLTAEKIEKIYGILNGTTNYILTKMDREGADFDAVLKEAQANGYAEKDPTADIEAHDPCRKIAILASLVTGKKVDWKNIRCEGITKLEKADFAYAWALDAQIKLVAMSEFTEKGCYACVSPRLLPADSPLLCAQDVFNAVLIHSNMLDDSLYYGRGAGKLATASAVVGDAIEAAANPGRTMGGSWSEEAALLGDIDEYEQGYFVRLSGAADARREEVQKVFGNGYTVEAKGVPGEFGYVVQKMREGAFLEKIAAMEGVLGYLRYDAPAEK
ncbi:MAG: homoserine dehydrogenase [Lachnospiraceae bacterium]|nr:homoserine dehydrogenase [Lachnospiraceae bacterium]